MNVNNMFKYQLNQIYGTLLQCCNRYYETKLSVKVKTKYLASMGLDTIHHTCDKRLVGQQTIAIL